jgi:outer membrane lipoprotein-sorting protein
MKRSLLLIFLCIILAPAVSAQETAAIDPGAKKALEEMVRAYRRLRTLDQESVYTLSGMGSAPMVRSRLVLQRPNRLLIETFQKVPDRQTPLLTRLLADGRDLYTYQEAQGYYTRVKAPKNLEGLREFVMSLEMAALTGLNPFEELEKQARAVRLEGTEPLDGVITDVILLDMSTEDRVSEARLYIGQKDHLLRRFQLDQRDLHKPDPPKNDIQPSPDEPLRLKEPPLLYRYDNRVLADRSLPKETFQWVPPQNAMLYLPPEEMFDPRRNRNTVALPSGKPLDTSRKTKPLTYKDLLEQAKKQKRR